MYWIILSLPENYLVLIQMKNKNASNNLYHVLNILNLFSIKNKQCLNSVILVKQQNVTTGEKERHYWRMRNAKKTPIKRKRKKHNRITWIVYTLRPSSYTLR